MNSKKGVSLIMLTLSIAIMVILTAAVILKLRNDKQIERAHEVSFKADITELQRALDIYVSDKSLKDKTFNTEDLNATAFPDIKNIITEFPSKYKDVFIISKGKLIYVGTDENEVKWAKQLFATKDTVIYDSDEPELSNDDINNLVD